MKPTIVMQSDLESIQAWWPVCTECANCGQRTGHL